MLNAAARSSGRTRPLRLARRSALRSFASQPTSSSSSDPLPPPPSSAPSTSHATTSGSANSTPAARARTGALFHPSPRTGPARSGAAPPSFLPYLSPSFGRNQMLQVPDATRALLEEIVRSFHAPIRYAFAYGSGVFEQAGYAAGAPRPMLDFVFAVTHPDHWHSINMHQHPGHYPLHARMLGSGLVSKVQQMGPGLWFNTLVPMNGVTIKYGVTTVDNLCDDLLNWRTLYLAGRMHKPIRIIKDDPRVRLTQQVNLVSAVRAALLTLPPDFTPAELFTRIAGASYAGDPRMLLPAENRGKVANIVATQAPQFAELYRRLVVGLPGVHWPAGGARIEQDASPRARAALLRKLPAHLLERVVGQYAGRADIPAKEADDAVYWQRIAADERLSDVILQETINIVRGPAAVQTVKGIVSAGLVKSTRYSAEKVGKWWNGKSKATAGPQV